MVIPELIAAFAVGMIPTSWLAKRFLQNLYWGWLFDFLKAVMMTIVLRNQSPSAAWAGMAILVFGHVFNPLRKFRGFTALPLFIGCMTVLSMHAAVLGGLIFVYSTWLGKPMSVRVLACMATAMVAHWAFFALEPYYAFSVLVFLMIAHQHEKEMDELLSSYTTD